MYFDKILHPAVVILNRVPFKFKIIMAISILFVLLILPSRNLFLNYFEEKRGFEDKLIGLQYNNYIHDVINVVQMHRGYSNGYISGDATLKKDIIENEKLLDQKIDNLFKFDKRNLNLLSNNKNFIKSTSQLELVKIENIKDNTLGADLFSQHSYIVALLMKTLQDTAKLTSFDVSDDLSIRYISELLEEKLLLLHEYTAQARGEATGILVRKVVSTQEKKSLLSLYTLIQTFKASLLDTEVLEHLDNYALIQKEITLISYKLDEIQQIINKNIIFAKIPSYDSKLFFNQSTAVLQKQTELHQILSNSYKNIVENTKQEKDSKLANTTAIYLSITLILLYFFVAFYDSVVKSLKKLKTASEMISSGNMNIQLEVDAKDEIGDAVLAFNTMSEKLDKNISFLDGYKMAIDETSVVSKSDKKGIITYANKMFCELSGYNEDELIGRPHNIVRHPDMPKEAFKDLWQTIKSKKIWKGVVKNRRKDGGHYIVDATIIPILDSDDNVIEYVAVRHDITELEDSKEEIKKQKIDLLTSLPNRNQLLEDLQSAKKPILLYLNVDNFANLNDFYGAKIGDGVLKHLANILTEVKAQAKCKSYKLHADGFMLLFEEGNLNRENYKSVFEKIIDYIEKKTIDCDEKSCVSITVSGGISFYQEKGSHENLLTNVNIARKIAKAGDKKFLLYDKSMNRDDDYANNMNWIKKIKSAIDENRIITFFQPIIDNRSGAITKYESLVRIIDEEGKAISPFFFLEIAKKAKLYSQITKIVIDRAFKTFEDLPQYEFSLNLSIEDIENPQTTAYIYKKLSNYTYANRVIFEITESEEIKNYEKVKEFIKNVKSYGVKIAIDDFGSGYANFSYILDLDADFIKIDGSLIKDIVTNKDSHIITEAIIAFSKKLGCKTVVEFVHNEDVYEVVKSLGADFSQGFYLGEPKLELVSIKDDIKAQIF